MDLRNNMVEAYGFEDSWRCSECGEHFETEKEAEECCLN